ncbi:hypothetical protein [Nonomuraea dietziae]|uniref:hypothetical protein n=1 Tax=Nonomuraea dietziae TaxID=65515 RepID=UPI0034138A08
MTSWLTYGLHGRDPNTVANYRTLCEKHVIPDLGARKLRELSAEDVDKSADRQGQGVEHAHGSAPAFLPQSGGEVRPGA